VYVHVRPRMQHCHVLLLQWQIEHFIYPQVAEWLCNGQLTWKNGQAYFRNQILEHPIRFASW
ncbi:hypothetical protein ACFMKF_23065, partial [Acinetobacter baumannii]